MLHHIRLLNLDSRLTFGWFFHPTKYQGDHKRLDCLSDDEEEFDLQLHIENSDDDLDDEKMYTNKVATGTRSTSNGSHHSHASIELSHFTSKSGSSSREFKNSLVDMSDH